MDGAIHFKVGVLRPIQQSGSYGDRPLTLSLEGVEPIEMV